MSERWPLLSGRIESGVHVLPVRVYYEDTDAGGVVYHANYLRFCERSRSDCLRVLGIHQNRLEDMFFVVRRMTCDFIRPARLDDLLEIETRFMDMGGARLELGQRVMLNGNTLFNASVTVALIDGRGRPKRLPQFMAERFKSLLEAHS